jgi:hypothetical protein
MNKSTLAALLSTALLAACGGGGDGAASQPLPPVQVLPPPVQAGTSSGILSDSPVGGVQYTTSGGYSGVTAADGRYAYNPGETVTFKIGAITLGTVTATGTVTPLELASAATNKENVATNLLVLLQSLDSDGNPANGITINDATKTAAATATTIDLTQAPASFASTSNSTLTTVMSTAKVPKTAPVSEADALAHFKAEFFKNLAGSWVISDAENVIVARFDTNGNYIIGQVSPSDQAGHSGTEVGHMNWDAKTGKVAADSIQHDSNGNWGMNDSSGSVVFKVDGDKVIVTETGETPMTFSRVKNNTTSPLIGTWAVGSSTTIKTQTFTFFESGKYMMADPLGDTEYGDGDPKCGEGGIEWGVYTFDAATGKLSVTTAPTVDTNGCAGLWDKPANAGLPPTTLEFNSDKSSFTIEGTVVYRVSK